MNTWLVLPSLTVLLFKNYGLWATNCRIHDCMYNYCAWEFNYSWKLNTPGSFIKTQPTPFIGLHGAHNPSVLKMVTNNVAVFSSVRTPSDAALMSTAVYFTHENRSQLFTRTKHIHSSHCYVAYAIENLHEMFMFDITSWVPNSLNDTAEQCFSTIVYSGAKYYIMIVCLYTQTCSIEA